MDMQLRIRGLVVENPVGKTASGNPNASFFDEYPLNTMMRSHFIGN